MGVEDDKCLLRAWKKEFCFCCCQKNEAKKFSLNFFSLIFYFRTKNKFFFAEQQKRNGFDREWRQVILDFVTGWIFSSSSVIFFKYFFFEFYKLSKLFEIFEIFEFSELFRAFRAFYSFQSFFKLSKLVWTFWTLSSISNFKQLLF